VWVLRPKSGDVRSVVVYIHGWTATTPFEWHQAWLDHLLARGSAVVFPRYQEGNSEDPPILLLDDLREGLQRGFRALGEEGVPVVTAGFSWGGALAFYYAANAGRWGLPPPRAVYSIFPVDPISADPLGDRLPGPTRSRVLILVGEDDEVVSDFGAKFFWRWLAPVPAALKEYRVIRTTDALLADHEAPTYVSSPAVRRTFWAPLDRLIAEAGQG
jgi:pimeloyl-ACP methyl ester carboxylesterase